jgi:hypothetical protein
VKKDGCVEKINKIFGIGLSRTGTKSLTEALRILGFSIAHYPTDKKTYQELISHEEDFSLLNRMDGITDITVLPYYMSLDKKYPNSKFILTCREKESWLAAMEKHLKYNKISEKKRYFLTERKIRKFLRTAVYGCFSFDKEKLSGTYESHLTHVRNYFRNRPESFLEIYITEGEGWEKLCPFLGKEVLSMPFPRI